MIIKKLSLYNFKNHSEKKFEFSPQINCFVGNNGVGKTNILDALHYLSVGKSFLGNTDINNIKKEEDFFMIDSEIQNEDSEDIIRITQPKEAKKVIKKNDKSYDRLADHIGYLPSVMISPYDSNLISDSGESRRKFLDAMISQTDSEYLFDLIQYQKTVQQRNALLKYFAKNRTWDKDSLEIYDEPITRSGTKIFNKRKEFVEQLNPIVQNFYQIISGGKETVSVIYESHLLENSFEELLKESLERDRMLTYTSKGIHKDDLLFEMDQVLIKKIGSQGQQKSFLISLKLAQMSLVKELTNKTPILLLDDIFDKLDDTRVSQLIELVNKESFGQIFITDTHRERTESVVKKINEESVIFDV
ncbi:MULTISPECIES: DNA replication/repair protein RecF [Chryseobacterium]|uniref:DNA replication and repair protein RecF n=1 Tax=Chryseobacterium indologenes TaxID=253 RepID=A0AAD1DU47_CHRID|nr:MULTISPECIES: DNA replication/repair protein RecF [Chryseobacterium]ASE61816.1 DNA replication and repair protein RecF [Chryseobacterium indologenes]ATN05774.1 DNA replication and repair protein RecF [Chryseobacterium indologenes]AYY85469.1 DNA replication/repair protein RecF [Chryseobacterium indologenes]AZB17425.1 DNA replication/repair protein RecF [Chryseobacterium indologenes]QIX82365.1 DNA replication/repair protein RecF [Chryseobacterium indologenes]